MGILHGPRKTKPKSTRKYWFTSGPEKNTYFFGMRVSVRVWDLPETRLGAKVPKMFVYIRYICVFWICFWYTYIFEFFVWISGYSFGFRVKIQILKIYFWVLKYNFGYFLVPQTDFEYNFRYFEYFLIFGYLFRFWIFFVFRVFLCLSSFIWVLNIWTDPYPLRTKNNIYFIGIWIMESNQSRSERNRSEPK